MYQDNLTVHRDSLSWTKRDNADALVAPFDLWTNTVRCQQQSVPVFALGSYKKYDNSELELCLSLSADLIMLTTINTDDASRHDSLTEQHRSGGCIGQIKF